MVGVLNNYSYEVIVKLDNILSVFNMCPKAYNKHQFDKYDFFIYWWNCCECIH